MAATAAMATVGWAGWAEWTCNERSAPLHAGKTPLRRGFSLCGALACSSGFIPAKAPQCVFNPFVLSVAAAESKDERSPQRGYNPAAMSPEIVVLNTLRALVEVAALMLLLRGIMWSFGPKARGNFIYGIFTVGSMPFIRFARAMMPRAVPDRYVPAIAFLLLFSLWLALMLGLQTLCVRPGIQCV
jgi:hypothetical protein